MFPTFLQPEIVAREDGFGPVIEIPEDAPRLLSLTLGITRTREQQSLDVSVWGSSDAQNWGPKPLAAFPQKFYCGTYTILVDLAGREDIRYLRIHYKMNRWGRGEPIPIFGFYVAADAVKVQTAGSSR